MARAIPGVLAWLIVGFTLEFADLVGVAELAGTARIFSAGVDAEPIREISVLERNIARSAGSLANAACSAGLRVAHLRARRNRRAGQTVVAVRVLRTRQHAGAAERVGHAGRVIAACVVVGIAAADAVAFRATGGSNAEIIDSVRAPAVRARLALLRAGREICWISVLTAENLVLDSVAQHVGTDARTRGFRVGRARASVADL